MKYMKRTAALLCAAMLLCASCGRTEQTATTAPQNETTTAAADAGTTVSASATTAVMQTASETDVSEAQTSAAEQAEITLEAGLNSTDIAEVLQFYKLAAAQNDVDQYTKTLELVSLDGGEGKVASYVNVFEPIAKKAVAKNTVTGDPLPGKYKFILPEDWRYAEAQSDGTYTTIRVQVMPQTDGARGKAFDGPVGRSLTVLDGVDQAVNEMAGVSADFDSGEVEIAYLDPTIAVTVDNRTGKFVPGTCRWTYRVQTTLVSLDAKILAFRVHLQNASGVINYTISY